MKSVTTHAAKTHLSRLLDRALAGEEVVIYRGKVPVAILQPVRHKGRHGGRPRLGTITSGPVKCSADAFLPLTDAELEEWGL